MCSDVELLSDFNSDLYTIDRLVVLGSAYFLPQGPQHVELRSPWTPTYSSLSITSPKDMFVPIVSQLLTILLALGAVASTWDVNFEKLTAFTNSPHPNKTNFSYLTVRSPFESMLFARQSGCQAGYGQSPHAKNNDKVLP